MPAAGMSICAFGASTAEANNEPFIADTVTYLKTLDGPKLIIPPGDFTCTDPVILDLPNYSRIEFQGRIISSVSGDVAVRIGSDSAPTFGTRFTGVHVDRSTTDMTSGGVTSSSIGVEIRNLVWAIGDIRRITGFTVGLQVRGTEANGGVSYCQFHLGLLHDNKINLALTASGVGYVNENTFYGGGLNHSSNYPNYTGTFNILVSHFAASPLNNNVFVRPSLEGNSSLTRAAELSGECNGILWPRLENPGDQTGFAIVFTAQSQECFLLTGFSIQNSNVSDSGVANCVETRESKFLKKLTNSGNPLLVAQSINSSGAKLWQGRTAAGVESSSIDGNGGAAFSTLKLTSLPTSNPHVAGALWSSSGTVQISSG